MGWGLTISHTKTKYINCKFSEDVQRDVALGRIEA